MLTSDIVYALADVDVLEHRIRRLQEHLDRAAGLRDDPGAPVHGRRGAGVDGRRADLQALLDATVRRAEEALESTVSTSHWTAGASGDDDLDGTVGELEGKLMRLTVRMEDHRREARRARRHASGDAYQGPRASTTATRASTRDPGGRAGETGVLARRIADLVGRLEHRLDANDDHPGQAMGSDEPLNPALLLPAGRLDAGGAEPGIEDDDAANAAASEASAGSSSASSALRAADLRGCSDDRSEVSLGSDSNPAVALGGVAAGGDDAVSNGGEASGDDGDRDVGIGGGSGGGGDGGAATPNDVAVGPRLGLGDLSAGTVAILARLDQLSSQLAVSAGDGSSSGSAPAPAEPSHTAPEPLATRLVVSSRIAVIDLEPSLPPAGRNEGTQTSFSSSQTSVAAGAEMGEAGVQTSLSIAGSASQRGLADTSVDSVGSGPVDSSSASTATSGATSAGTAIGSLAASDVSLPRLQRGGTSLSRSSQSSRSLSSVASTARNDDATEEADLEVSIPCLPPSSSSPPSLVGLSAAVGSPQSPRSPPPPRVPTVSTLSLAGSISPAAVRLASTLSSLADAINGASPESSPASSVATSVAPSIHVASDSEVAGDELEPGEASDDCSATSGPGPVGALVDGSVSQGAAANVEDEELPVTDPFGAVDTRDFEAYWRMRVPRARAFRVWQARTQELVAARAAVSGAPETADGTGNRSSSIDGTTTSASSGGVANAMAAANPDGRETEPSHSEVDIRAFTDYWSRTVPVARAWSAWRSRTITSLSRRAARQPPMADSSPAVGDAVTLSGPGSNPSGASPPGHALPGELDEMQALDDGAVLPTGDEMRGSNGEDSSTDHPTSPTIAPLPPPLPPTIAPGAPDDTVAGDPPSEEQPEDGSQADTDAFFAYWRVRRPVSRAFALWRQRTATLRETPLPFAVEGDHSPRNGPTADQESTAPPLDSVSTSGSEATSPVGGDTVGPGSDAGLCSGNCSDDAGSDAGHCRGCDGDSTNSHNDHCSGDHGDDAGSHAGHISGCSGCDGDSTNSNNDQRSGDDAANDPGYPDATATIDEPPIVDNTTVSQPDRHDGENKGSIGNTPTAAGNTVESGKASEAAPPPAPVFDDENSGNGGSEYSYYSSSSAASPDGSVSGSRREWLASPPATPPASSSTSSNPSTTPSAAAPGQRPAGYLSMVEPRDTRLADLWDAWIAGGESDGPAPASPARNPPRVALAPAVATSRETNGGGGGGGNSAETDDDIRRFRHYWRIVVPAAGAFLQWKRATQRRLANRLYESVMVLGEHGAHETSASPAAVASTPVSELADLSIATLLRRLRLAVAIRGPVTRSPVKRSGFETANSVGARKAALTAHRAGRNRGPNHRDAAGQTALEDVARTVQQRAVLRHAWQVWFQAYQRACPTYAAMALHREVRTAGHGVCIACNTVCVSVLRRARAAAEGAVATQTAGHPGVLY